MSEDLPILVVGTDTPLGEALCQFFDLRGTEYVALPRSDCRWKNERQVKKALRRATYRFVVDLRLQSAVDSGGRLHDIDINRSLWLARASRTLKLPVMLVSSAMVFAGLEGHAYSEEDHPDGHEPLSQLLASAEELLRENNSRHVVLRLGTVFSARGSNPLTYLLAQLHENGYLTLDRHRRGCPVPVDDAARVVSGMLDQYSCGLEQWGVYHYCSPDMTSCYGFSEVLLAAASQYTSFADDTQDALLRPVEGEVREFRLACEKIRDTFAIKQQPWRASVAASVKQFYAKNSPRERQDDAAPRQQDATA
ncbi:MAG: sugar nucleotide-binding protein [Pseudomonadota bacterium]